MVSSTAEDPKGLKTFLLLDLRAFEMPPMATRIPIKETPITKPHFHLMITVDLAKQINMEKKKDRTIIQAESGGLKLASRKIPNKAAREILKNGILLHIPSCSFFLA
jgi:hypothetical protein